MIQIRVLTMAVGGNRFGSCVSCGKSASNGNKMVRIRFNSGSYGTSICLCSKCLDVLKAKLKEGDAE